MREGQRKAMNAREAAAPRVFRVESVQPYGWIIYLEGFAETYHFMSHSLAMMYAREWAKVNAHGGRLTFPLESTQHQHAVP